MGVKPHDPDVQGQHRLLVFFTLRRSGFNQIWRQLCGEDSACRIITGPNSQVAFPTTLAKRGSIFQMYLSFPLVPHPHSLDAPYTHKHGTKIFRFSGRTLYHLSDSESTPVPVRDSVHCTLELRLTYNSQAA